MLGAPVKLVTADGSFDCLSNPSEQEAMTSHLHLCEVLAALEVLTPEGCLIVKMFTMFEASTICLLFLLCCCFENVSVYKPITSKLGNSEVYVVCMGYYGRTNAAISKHLDVLMSSYSSESSIKVMFSQSDLPESFVRLVTECAGQFKSHQVAAIERNVHLYRFKGPRDVLLCNYLQNLVLQVFIKNNEPLGEILECDNIISGGIDWDPFIHPETNKNNKWMFNYSKICGTDNNKLIYVQDQLLHYLRLYQKFEKQRSNLYFYGVVEVLHALRITKGVPFAVVNTTRFCYQKLLNLYIGFVALSQKLNLAPVKYDNCNDDDGRVIFIKDNEECDKIIVNTETAPLIDSLLKFYPNSNILVQEYPSHQSAPSSSCVLLEKLYNLLFTKSLPENSTIYLVNFSLFSRLQNGLFVTLSSCFKYVELHDCIQHFMSTSEGCVYTRGFFPPVIMLQGLQLSKSTIVIDRLHDAGFTVGAPSKGVMEVIDVHTLVGLKSHSLVCRYNAQLSLMWTAMVAARVKEAS